MPTPWLDLLVIGVVVFLSRLIAPRLPVAVPDTVLQLIGGLLLGPAGLGWLRVDDRERHHSPAGEPGSATR